MAETDRDEGVTRAYRELGGAEPPRALDEAILAAARRPRARWRVPVSIAAVLMLSVGVTLRMLPEEPEAQEVALSPRVMETPRPAAAPPARKKELAEAQSQARSQEPSTAPSQAPAAAAADAGRRDERVARGAAAENRAATPAPAPALAKLRSAPVELKPEAWLERIAELRKQGRKREADESLAEFRKRYPDHQVPAALAH